MDNVQHFKPLWRKATEIGKMATCSEDMLTTLRFLGTASLPLHDAAFVVMSVPKNTADTAQDCIALAPAARQRPTMSGGSWVRHAQRRHHPTPTHVVGAGNHSDPCLAGAWG
eukprot:jgi/Tetstr1/453567/TSEL_040535.t1